MGKGKSKRRKKYGPSGPSREYIGASFQAWTASRPRSKVKPVLSSNLKRTVWAAAAILFVAFNVIAYMQAWSMSHLARQGQGSPRAEDLHGLTKLKVLVLGAVAVRRPNDEDPSSRGLAFESLTLTGASVDSLSLWLVPAKGARWALLLHGYLSSKSSQLDEAAEIHRMGWNVALMDLPGHGDSGGDSTSVGYKDGADVALLVRWLREARGAGRVVLYGNSMGAAAALRAQASFGAAADGLILECPFNRFLDTVGNRFRLMGLPAFPGAEALLFWGSLQQGVNLFAYRLDREAARIREPALVFAGERDVRAPLADARAVEGAFPGPAELVLFLGAGHQAYLHSDTDLWRSKVEGFLARF